MRSSHEKEKVGLYLDPELENPLELSLDHLFIRWFWCWKIQSLVKIYEKQFSLGFGTLLPKKGTVFFISKL